MRISVLTGLCWAVVTGLSLAQPSLETLRWQLLDPIPSVRSEAAHSLSIAEDSETAFALLLDQLARDPSTSVRDMCLRSLQDLVDNHSERYRAAFLDKLERLAGGAHPRRRVESLAALLSQSQAGRRRSRAQLLQALLGEAAGDDPEARREAIQVLLWAPEPLAARGLAALWARSPEDPDLLSAMQKVADWDESVRLSLEPFFLARLRSPDLRQAGAAWEYFGKPRRAWSLRPRLQEQVQAETRPAVRARAALSFALAFDDWEPWRQALHRLVRSELFSERALALTMLTQPGRPPSEWDPAVQQLCRDPQLGPPLLAWLLSKQQVGPEVLPALLPYLSRPASHSSLMQALPNWLHASRAVPALTRVLRDSPDPLQQLAACSALVDLEQAPLALSYLRRLAGQRSESAPSALVLLWRCRQVSDQEILDLARRSPQTRTWKDWRRRPDPPFGVDPSRLRKQLASQDPEQVDEALQKIKRSPPRPDLRPLILAAYSRNPDRSRRAELGTALLQYGDRRFLEDAIRDLERVEGRSGNLAVSLSQEAFWDYRRQLSPEQRRRLCRALERLAPALDDLQARLAGNLHWELERDVGRLTPFLYRTTLNAQILEKLPLAEAAAHLQEPQWAALATYLEGAARTPPSAGEFAAVCQLLLAAYPASTRLRPQLESLQQSSDPTLRAWTAATLEKMP